ncbi:MAG: CDP-diacylglycerol--serine O-phosphatidyltransferase [Rhodobacterales bacterium]|nr:MAG: CDP-diacylglycerol--serine O-phosphatidyltransferase [Rhodobacterales bacterium]
MNHRAARNVPLRRFIPNFVTIFALCAGLTAVREGFAGHFHNALGLLMLAAVLDGIDGKLARMLNSASQFGAELDTLADFFNFGIAPTILLYLMFFAGSEFDNLGWLALIIFTIACMMRLARFNVALLEEEDRPVDKSFLVGVPAPAMACLGFLPAFLFMSGWKSIGDYPVLIAFYIIICGALAVSRLPTLSIKYLNIKPRHQFWLFAAVVLALVILSVFPWHMLVLVDLIYLASLPITWSMARKQTKPE